MSGCPQSCRPFDGEKAADALVGAIVVDTNEVGFYAFRANTGALVRSHRAPVANAPNPRPGWAEQDPAAVMDAVHKCVADAAVSGRVLGLPVVAVGVANHRCSVVAWNRDTGAPLHNVVLWSDNRAAAMVQRCAEFDGAYRYHKACGLPMSPYFSGFKIKWLLENDERVRAAYRDGVCCFGTVDSWLVWNLTGGIKNGVYATDSTNASHTFLMNINTLEWDSTLLKFFGISPDCLPKIRSSSEVYGKIANGPLSGVPISGVIGNRQAALIGHRCFRRGLTKATLDDSGCVFTVTGENKVFSSNGLLTTIAYHLDTRPVFALEGPIAAAGKTIEWAKRCLNVRESECLVSDKSEIKRNPVYVVPAFNGLYAPHWRSEAGFVLTGVDTNTIRDDLLKAAMESVGFQTVDIVESLRRDMKMPIDKIKIDGELSSHKFLMQSVSDITNTRVEVANSKEIAALGAAMAAGYAAEINVWNAQCMPDENNTLIFNPKMKVDERKSKIFDWKRSSRRSYNWFKYKTNLSHLWSIIPLATGTVLFGAYLYLKRH